MFELEDMEEDENEDNFERDISPISVGYKLRYTLQPNSYTHGLHFGV